MGEYCDYLECNHCGGPAIYADADKLFYDGDGDVCLTCGWPGHVSCDGDEEEGGGTYWAEDEDYEGKCIGRDCSDCYPEANQ